MRAAAACVSAFAAAVDAALTDARASAVADTKSSVVPSVIGAPWKNPALADTTDNMVLIPVIRWLHDLGAALSVEVLGHSDHFSFDCLVTIFPLSGQSALVEIPCVA